MFNLFSFFQKLFGRDKTLKLSQGRYIIGADIARDVEEKSFQASPADENAVTLSASSSLPPLPFKSSEVSLTTEIEVPTLQLLPPYAATEGLSKAVKSKTKRSTKKQGKKNGRHKQSKSTRKNTRT